MAIFLFTISSLEPTHMDMKAVIVYALVLGLAWMWISRIQARNMDDLERDLNAPSRMDQIRELEESGDL